MISILVSRLAVSESKAHKVLPFLRMLEVKMTTSYNRTTELKKKKRHLHNSVNFHSFLNLVISTNTS